MCVWGGGGGGGDWEGDRRSDRIKVSRYSLYTTIHKISSSYFSGLLVLKQIKGVTDGLEKDITLPMIYGIQSKVNQVTFTLILNIILNFRIQAQAIL